MCQRFQIAFFTAQRLWNDWKRSPRLYYQDRSRSTGIAKDEVSWRMRSSTNELLDTGYLESLFVIDFVCVRFDGHRALSLCTQFSICYELDFSELSINVKAHPDIILSFVLVKKKKPEATKSSIPAVGQKSQRGKEKHFGKYCQFWDIASQRHLTKNVMLNISLKYPCFKRSSK